MKIFLSVDMEGICGVVGDKETDPENGGDAYQENCHRMTAEANAAIEGALKAGATEIVVADSHWNFDNLIPEELAEAAKLMRGYPRAFSMVHDLDGSFDALLCVGCHAMAGTPRAIIDHTFSGAIRGVEVNGRVIGETGLNAYVAGEFGVPVVLVTGDTAVAAEAKALLPRVHAVAVKEAITTHAATHLHPQRAHDLIRVEAEKAVREAAEIEPLANEVNDLLGHTDEMVKRARRETGDLAHALKTPLTVIRNEARRVEGEPGAIISEQTAAISGWLDRFLSRARTAATRRVLGARSEVAGNVLRIYATSSEGLLAELIARAAAQGLSVSDATSTPPTRGFRIRPRAPQRSGTCAQMIRP